MHNSGNDPLFYLTPSAPCLLLFDSFSVSPGPGLRGATRREGEHSLTEVMFVPSPRISVEHYQPKKVLLLPYCPSFTTEVVLFSWRW